MSMYRQLWLAVIISTLLALCGGLLASLLSARGYLESQLSIKNSDNATALALSLSQNNPDAVTVDLVVASLFDGGHYELIRVTEPNGKVVTERVAPAGNLVAPGWFVRALPIHAQPGNAQITNGWKQLGVVTLVSHSKFAYGALWKSAYEMVLALTAAGLVGGYLGSLVLRRLRIPLNTVIEQAKAITQRRFVTVDEPTVPELKQLAAAMNATVGRLKVMFEEEASRIEVLRREANCDVLTGLANRNYFMSRLRLSLDTEDAVPGALLLVRLANLAGVNHRLGRAATDDFLHRTAEVIRRYAGRYDRGLGARLNGADFALMLPGDESGWATAQKILNDLIEIAGQFFQDEIVAQIGVGRFEHGMEPGALLAGVDGALASAEASGRNAVQEVLADDARLPRTAQEWSKMIRQALEERRVRLASFPVLERSGQLLHWECPLRLMFDGMGEWLPAGRFLPIAERLKLTPALDLEAVNLGLQELKQNPQLIGVAINLSGSSLDDVQFLPRLLTILEAQRELTPRLWLEVAESGALKHLEAFRAFCGALKGMGCRIGLEHFGHQFSQIGLLHDLGLDYVKVDASFIHGVDANEGNVAFLKGLCGILHNIGLMVLGEGVAVPAESDKLIELGFDGVTGPAIKQPV